MGRVSSTVLLRQANGRFEYEAAVRNENGRFEYEAAVRNEVKFLYTLGTCLIFAC